MRMGKGPKTATEGGYMGNIGGQSPASSVTETVRVRGYEVRAGFRLGVRGWGLAWVWVRGKELG
jgi:hypothetical protein